MSACTTPRDLFAATDLAVTRGFKPIDFSLTHANGTRCENCTGDGIIVTNLQFMADIETVCPVCKGARFSPEGLEIKYNGKNISEVLDMTVEEAAEFFADNKYVRHKLSIMNELGLGYIKLGQNSTTLSGGDVVATGTPEEVARCERSHTGMYLKELM